MTDLDIRPFVYLALSVGNVAVWGRVAVRRPSLEHTALLIVAVVVSVAVMTLLLPSGPATPRGFVLSVALGAFMAAGIVTLTDMRDRRRRP